MKICQNHWDALRKALDDRGIGHLGAKTGQQAMAAVVTELEGREAENEFDPLMGCNWMIFSKAIEVCGMGLMGWVQDGSDKCPICESVKLHEQWWIDGPADAMLKEAQEKGLV